MSRILFGQSYALRLDPKPRDAGQPFAPLGTLYAAAVARSAGHVVALWDAMVSDSESEWTSALDRHRPQVAVLYDDPFNYLTKMCLARMREAALVCTREAVRRGVVVFVCSSDATDHPRPYLEAGARAVIAGEGERTLVDALAHHAAGAPLDRVRGLVLGDGASVRATEPRTPMTDLDALPRPAWDLVDVERYRRAWHRRHGYFSMNVATTRGCPYHCNWCAKPVWGQRYSARSPESVADEVAWLRRAYRPDHLTICDDIFGLVPGWIPRYADALAARGAVTPFRCLSRPDLLGEEVVSALGRAGCRTVWMGAESGSQRVLDAMEKGTTVEDVRRATARLRGAGIEVGFFVQFGYPGETVADIEATLALLRECAPDDVGVSVSYPLPGTRFHARVRDDLGRRDHWSDSADLAMLYRGPFSTRFYRRLHAVVHAEHRLRRARRARRSLRRAAALALHALNLPLRRAALALAARREPPRA